MHSSLHEAPPPHPACPGHRSHALDAAADWVLQELGRQSQDMMCAAERARYSKGVTAALLDRLSAIKDAGERQQHLIQDSLAYLGLQTGSMTLKPSMVVLDTLVTSAQDAVRDAALAQNVFIGVHVRHGVPAHLNTDADCLRHVLVALLRNAVDLSENGSVFLSVEPTGPEDRVEGLRFSVLDTGCGLRPAQLQALGQPLVETVDTPGTPPHRTLRLQVAQRRVRLLGGELRIDSSSGLGTYAHFVLPLR